MKGKVVVALGGNALGNNPEEQIELVKDTAVAIVDMAIAGYEILIGHGNGPQVGMINLGMEYASQGEAGTPAIPFPECGAMSQGYIGYHLQQAIGCEMRRQGMSGSCVTVVTQVLVDGEDSAFKNPTKPIGAFYSEAEAREIEAKSGYTFVEDAGRGYRRVIASPIPKKIVEVDVVKQLAESGNLVITVGGGGIPVVEKDGGLSGVAAVIDKDRSSALLSVEVEADTLVILTAVEHVYVDFNKPSQRALESITVEEAKRYIAEGQFAKGSMLPKVEACIEFLERGKPGATAIITSLEKAGEALNGNTGTIMRK